MKHVTWKSLNARDFQCEIRWVTCFGSCSSGGSVVVISGIDCKAAFEVVVRNAAVVIVVGDGIVTGT